MSIKIQRETVNGVDCSVHLLPPDAWKEAEAGYGMRIVSFGRAGRSGSSEFEKPKPRYFEFFCISHLLDGRGYYWTPENGTLHFEPGSAVVMRPGIVHSYGGYGEFYVEDTVCFCGPLADKLDKAGLLTPGVVDFGLERRLLSVITKTMDPSPLSQIAACVELQKVIIGLDRSGGRDGAGGAKGKVESLLEELKLNPEPWWTVEGMAARCGLGELQFRRIFTELAGMPPKRYVERLKMQRAIEMLAVGKEPVAEIGRSLSYADPFHFSRRFKAVMGLSPADYRRSVGL